MIDGHQLANRYGAAVAVEGLRFTAQPSRVTGFLGPNGAGKSTTMRVILGLHVPSAGRATIGGRPYARLRPVAPGGCAAGCWRRARRPHRPQHGLAIAASNGIGARRVDEVLGLVGLDSAAHRRVRGFSLGLSSGRCRPILSAHHVHGHSQPQ